MINLRYRHILTNGLAVILLCCAHTALASQGNPTFQEAFQLNTFSLIVTFGLYAFFAVILFLLFWLLRKAGVKRTRWVITPLAVVLLAFPWAEEAWLAWRFSNLCQDAGLHVYKTVEVDGYFNSQSTSLKGEPGPVGKPSIRSHNESGYKYTEEPWNRDPSKVYHLENPGTQWTVTILDSPVSRYEYRYKPVPKVPGLRAGEEAIGPSWWAKLWRREEQVIDRQTGEILSRKIWYTRNPSVVNALWVHFLGSGQTICFGPKSGNGTLKPKRNEP